MAKIVAGFARAATQAITNLFTPPSDAVALTDGEGNLLTTAATADSLAPASVPVFAVGVYNGTTVDRGRGSNGAISTLTPAAANVYSEAPVVNGARLTSGNITGGSIPNNASLFLVSVAVSVFTGGTNLVYSLQVQDTNGNWVTVGSSATITATGTYAFSVGPGTTNGNVLPSGNGNWRVAWTATGAFTAVTSQIGVTGR